MDDNGEQIGDKSMAAERVFANEMERNTEELLDEVSARLSDLDVYILMKEFGLFGEKLRRKWEAIEKKL